MYFIGCLPNNNVSYQQEKSIRHGTKIQMINKDGVYYIPIEVDGLNLNFIFDTGASAICISQAEATVMYKQGQITDSDILEQGEFVDATGSVNNGIIVNLKDVRIGDIILHNIQATVVNNINAPLLLGQTALSKFGKISINYDENYIEFN